MTDINETITDVLSPLPEAPKAERIEDAINSYLQSKVTRYSTLSGFTYMAQFPYSHNARILFGYRVYRTIDREDGDVVGLDVEIEFIHRLDSDGILRRNWQLDRERILAGVAF